MFPTAKELKERYASWSNRRLLLVIHQKNQYTAQAVEIARLELSQRNITAEEVDVFLYELEQQQRADKILSGIGLTPAQKAFCFFFWFVPFPPRFGLATQENQRRNFSVAGFISSFTSAFTVVFFNLPGVLGAAITVPLFLTFYWYEKDYKGL